MQRPEQGRKNEQRKDAWNILQAGLYAVLIGQMTEFSRAEVLSLRQ